MTMITPSLVPSSDPLVTAASVLEFALGASLRSTITSPKFSYSLSLVFSCAKEFYNPKAFITHAASRANSADIHHTGGRSSMHLEGPIRPIVSRITIHWPSFYNVVTGKTLALPNLIALQHIPLSPAGVIAKRPAPIALPNSCAA